jgi:fructose-specific component phosphotransferase system IIB-like protein
MHSRFESLQPTKLELHGWTSASGDLGDDSFVLIKAAAKSKRLTWEEVQDADLTQVSTNAINPQKASLAKLNAWLSRREEATRRPKG